MNEKEIKDLAETHWIYVESICHKMYVDAFIHGFKHGTNNQFDDMANPEKEFDELLKNISKRKQKG